MLHATANGYDISCGFELNWTEKLSQLVMGGCGQDSWHRGPGGRAGRQVQGGVNVAPPKQPGDGLTAMRASAYAWRCHGGTQQVQQQQQQHNSCWADVRVEVKDLQGVHAAAMCCMMHGVASLGS